MPRPPALPAFLQPLHTDEFVAPRFAPAERRVRTEVAATVADRAARTGVPPAWAATSRTATAVGLRALNRSVGATCYEVPEAAEVSDGAAAEVFAASGPVIDVQTHFLAPHSFRAMGRAFLFDMYQSLMPSWWSEMDDIDAWDFGEYLRNIFVESETALAVITSGPGDLDARNLFNDEMAAARLLVDATGGRGRLLNHAVVHADTGDIERMPEWSERFAPVGWKVYTIRRLTESGWASGWMLDDEEHGLPFLDRVRGSGVKLVCSHKGISRLADNGSPRDIGPAAAAYPDIDFLVYHSGYELASDGAPPEGPYVPEGNEHHGVDRLLHSLDVAGIPRGANVYAELGSTWFCLVSRPVEAAHVLGKLVARLGADNIVWGTDSIWFGSPQPLIDAFRSFQIPDELCERYGYEKLTDEVRQKILAGNASRIYGLDLDAVVAQKRAHDDAWAIDLGERYRSGRIAAFR